ncbi:NUC194 domain/Phosphatidylinositol 3- and 4-kinase, putative [Leishmania guyanensis]
MDEVISVILKCITQLGCLVDGPAADLSGKAASITIDTIGKCIADHAYLFTGQKMNGQRVWELVCPTPSTIREPHAAKWTLLSLFHRLADAVAASSRAPEADILKPLLKLLCYAVKPPLMLSASPGQLRCLFEAAMRLLRTLLPLKKHTDALAECLHLLLALMQPSNLQEAHCAVVASGDEAAQVAKMCTDVCGAKHNVALRPKNASMRLLGCLCEQPEYARALSRQLVERILKCFLDVARCLTQQTEVNQTLGEGLLRGLAGFLGTFPLRCKEDAPVLTLINNIVLSALMLGETSTNYMFCHSALFLLRRRASDTLAPFILLCAAEYGAALKALWVHRNKDVRRESHAAVAAFWSTLSSQLLQRHSSEVVGTSTTHNTDESHKLHRIVETLLRSLDSSADREASYALEALYHLLPAVAALSDTQTLQTMSTRLEERVGALLAPTSAVQTEALFRQAPYLLATLGQLLRLLPSVSPRQQTMVRELLDWILLLYPHPKFYDREKTVPGIMVVITALMHHPYTPHSTLPRLLSERTLELVGEAPGAAMMRLAGECISCEERLDCMATLWTKLLTSCEEFVPEAETESKQRLSIAFYRACRDFCERTRLEVVVVASNREATLEQILVDGPDGMQPRFPTQYSAFLSLVDFFVRLSEGLRLSDRVCHLPAGEMTLWLEALVRGASAAPHVSGFYTLLHRTLVGEGMYPHLSRRARPCMGASLVSGSSDITSDDHHHDHPCVSPPLRRFFSIESLRLLYVYSDELLYQCAMCVLIGVALVGSEEWGERIGSRARARDDRRLDAYVRALKVVLAPTPTPLHDESPTGGANDALYSFSSSPAMLESNRQYALRVLDSKLCHSPRWAAVVLPALTTALHSTEVATAVRASVQMLAARHGITIAAELQHRSSEATFALLCSGERASNGLRDSMPRWLATMQPVTVPLIPVDSALHIGYLIPLASRLSLHGKQPAIRTAAAEVLYWCAMWVLCKRVSHWYSAVFSPLLSLASLASSSSSTGGSSGGDGNSGSAVHQELHRLLMQTARWFGRPAGTPQEAESFVLVLLHGLGEREVRQRQVAMEALFAYAIPPTDEPQTATPHFLAVIRQLAMIECGASEWLRLGAAQCVHGMVRSLYKAKVPGLGRTVQAVVQGALGCLRRCTEVPLWGVMETATCNEVQEALRCVGAYCRDIRELGSEEDSREADQGAAYLVHAAPAVLPALVQRHIACAITLLQALPAVTHMSGSVHQVWSLSQQVVREQRQRMCPAAVKSLDSVVDGCAALVALLQSGCFAGWSERATVEAAPPVISARAEDYSLDPELLHLLTAVLQAIVEEARVATYEGRCVSPRLIRWLLELADVMPVQTHTTHFSQLFTPTVIAQAVRVMVVGAKVTMGQWAGDDGEGEAFGAPLRQCTPSSRLSTTARLGLELIQLVMRVVNQRRHGVQVVEEVLCAIQGTSVFDVFTAASPASRLIDALRMGPTALVTEPVALATALCQMETPYASAFTTLWVLIADSMKISPNVIVKMLLALLQNSDALNTAGGEGVCEGLFVLFFSEADPALLCQHLRTLLASNVVQHNSSFTSPLFSVSLDDDDGAVAVVSSSKSSSAALGRAFSSTMTRCWQQASATLPTDRLVSALPSLTRVLMSEAACRGPSEALFLLSLVRDWLAELQQRSLTSEHDKVLCLVCADMVAAEQEMRKSSMTEGQDDDRGVARLAALLMLVRLTGPGIHTVPTLSGALCNLVLCVSQPTNIYALLASTDATNRVVWGFHMFAAILTPRPAHRSLAVFPVDLRAVEVALGLLSEVLNNALPLRWTELKTPLEKVNGAKVARSGTALFAAVLPYKVEVLEVIAPLLAKESMPQRGTIVRHVHRALQTLSTCNQALQLDAFSCAFRLLRDQRTHPRICDALTDHVLLPLLHASAEAVRLQLFEAEVCNWVTEAGRAPAPGCLYVQTAALSCLELMHRLCPLSDLRGSINKVFTCRNPNTTGEELTLEILKACREAWQRPNTNGDNSAGETDSGVGDSTHAAALRRYRQAAFRCLLATLSKTQQAEKVFCEYLFQECCAAQWNVLFLVKKRDVVVTSSLDAEGEVLAQGGGVDPHEVQLWRDMNNCQLSELFAHLIRHFPSSLVVQGEPPEWVRHFVAIVQHPRVCLSVKKLFYECICRNERFLGTFARRIFDGVADSVAAVAPSERAGPVVWELLAVLTRWHREGGSGALEVGSPAYLKALARYAAFHLAWEHSFTAREGSRPLDLTSHKRLAELLEQIRRTQGAAPASVSSPPLTSEEVKTLLSHPGYDRRASLEVIYLVTNLCGCLGCTGDSQEVVEVYSLLGAFLDVSASPQLHRIAARLVGLEYRLLSEADTREPSSAVRKLLRDALKDTVCPILVSYESDKKFLDVLEAMQEDRSGDLVYQLLSHTDLLHRYSTRKDSEKLLILRILAHAGTYVADNYDSIHMHLSGQLCGTNSNLLLGVCTVMRNSLPHLSMESVRHFLRDFCCLSALQVLESVEQTRVAFYAMGLAALQRWAVMRGDQEKQDDGDSVSADVEAFLVHRGLRDSSPAVQGMVLAYLDVHAPNVPDTMWGRFTYLITAEDGANGDGDSGSGGWVRHSALLLLSLSKRLHNSANNTFSFTEALRSEGTSPTLTATATTVVESSGARRDPRNVPLFFQTVRYGDPSGAVTANAACLITTALSQIFVPSTLIPQPPQQQQQQPLSDARRPDAALRTNATVAPWRGAGTVSTSTVAQSWLHMDSSDSEQDDAGTSDRVMASRQISETMRLRTAHGAALRDGRAVLNTPSTASLLESHTAERFPEVRLVLKSLLAPLQILCLHEDAVAARVLIDLISNAAIAPSATSELPRTASLSSALTSLFSAFESGATSRQCEHAKNPLNLFVALELLLHAQAACGFPFESLDCAALVRLTNDAQARGGRVPTAPLPVADGTAHVVEKLLSSLVPSTTQGAPRRLSVAFPASMWHAYHVAQRLRRCDDAAFQSALRLFRATRGHGAQVSQLQGVLDAMEAGGAAYSVRLIGKLLEEEKEAAAIPAVASPATHANGEAPALFAAREEVLRHYRSRASQLLLDWGGAASTLQPAAPEWAGESEEASAEGVRFRLRAQLQLMCDRTASAATVRASMALQHRTGFEWGACLMADGLWLDCQRHVEASVDHLLRSTASLSDGDGISQTRCYIAANALSQLADAAQVLREASTSAVGSAKAALQTYLDTMPTSVPIGDAYGPLFIDDVLLIRKLVIDYHVQRKGDLANTLQLTDDERHKLVARAHELLGTWTVQQCAELLLLPAKTSAIETIASNANHSTLSEQTRCALDLLGKRSSLFRIAAMSGKVSGVPQEEAFAAFQQMTGKDMQQHAALGLLSPTALRQWAADVAQCEVEMFTSIGGILSGSTESTTLAQKRETWVAPLKDNLQDAIPSHMTLLSALEKLLPPVLHGACTLAAMSGDATDAAHVYSITAATRSLWQLYANTFLWCAQATGDRSVETDGGGQLPVSARVPQLLSLFALPPMPEAEAQAQWHNTWEALVQLPAQVWLPWATLLITTLLKTEHTVLARILLRLCREHGQVLYYPINCAWGSLADLGKCRATRRTIDSGLARELAELNEWHRGHRMALVAEFAAALDELVEPQHRLEIRLSEVELLVKQHKQCVRGGGGVQTGYLMEARQLYERCKETLMDPARWGWAQLYHRRAAQVLQELDRQSTFCTEVLRSEKRFSSAKREALRQVTIALNTLPTSVADSATSSQELTLYSERLPRVLRCSAMAMSTTTATLQLGCTSEAAEPILHPVQPTHLLHTPQEATQQCRTLIGVADQVFVLKSKRSPKKVDIYTSTGSCTYMVKGGKDLRLDQRIQEVFTFANLCLLASPHTRLSALMIRTYAVIPASPFVALVAWVPKTASLQELMREATPPDAREAVARFCRTRGKPQDILALYKSAHITRSPEQEYTDLVLCLRQSALVESLESIAPDYCSWFGVRDAFLNTNAAASTVSFVLGVGGRHTDTLMVDLLSCELVAMNFGLAFGDATRKLPVPELVPFRHTPQLQRVQGVLGNDVTRCRMRRVLHVLRTERHTIEGMVAALLMPDADAIGDEASCIAAHQLDLVRRKLHLENPADIILRDVARNAYVTQDKDVWSGIKMCLFERTQGNSEEDDDLAETALSTPQQEDVFVQRLLRIASDSRVLARADAGWQAYL